MNPSVASGARAGPGAYLRIARPDHWFKNVFLVPGFVAALALAGWSLPAGRLAWNAVLAIVAACLVASSNYVLNEILDARTDREHPEKRHRPIAAGQVAIALAWLEWALLAAAGFLVASQISPAFTAAAVALWLMAIVYNVPPLRAKEIPYLDVLTESVNNPLRLLMGWYAAGGPPLPPASLIVAYWMVGCYFMATKRFAEYRHLGDPSVAAGYRRSFAHYNENRLLITLMIYATAAAFFLGIFLIRYRIELILAAPLFAVFMGLYLRIGLKPDSPAMYPERLYRQKALMLWLVLSLAAGIVLLFVDIPLVARIFQPTV